MNTPARFRPMRITSAALASAGILALAGCSDPTQAPTESSGGSDETIIVGSANFPESQLLGTMYQLALEAQGVDVETRFDIGAREIYLGALDDGSIDLLPEYNGALLSFLDADAEATNSEEVYDALQDVMPEGIITLPQSEAEDKDTLTVTRPTAEEYGLETIADLAPVAGELSIAAGPEFAERQQGIIGLESSYGITFGEFAPLDAGGPLTLGALLNGDVEVANIFSTNSAISTEDLVVLEDTENLFLSENILPIINESKNSETVENALNSVSEALTTENLTEYLAMVTVDRMSYEDVAQAFLEEYDLA